MKILFAQVHQELSFQTIGIGVCMLLLFLVIAGLIVMLLDRNKKQPREVSFAGTPVDKKEFDQFKGETKEQLENVFSKIGGVERGVEARLRDEMRGSEREAKVSRAKLHEEMTTVREDISSLKANAESMDKRTERIEGKLDGFIQRAR